MVDSGLGLSVAEVAGVSLGILLFVGLIVLAGREGC
jgi:hypothetical protein